jgi:hypothetical protein
MLVFYFRDVGLSCDEFLGRAKADTLWAQQFILEYMLRMKQRVTINWKKITRLMPRGRGSSPWTGPRPSRKLSTLQRREREPGLCYYLQDPFSELRRSRILGN